MQVHTAVQLVQASVQLYYRLDMSFGVSQLCVMLRETRRRGARRAELRRAHLSPGTRGRARRLAGLPDPKMAGAAVLRARRDWVRPAGPAWRDGPHWRRPDPVAEEAVLRLDCVRGTDGTALRWQR
ncbi:hypothetical protein NDU88_001309 [Pleurodeles waltl]|uniref:Uncharacterized protein n=1 Tax=Pleurodeles waltl TaxID=8319 RepID=A0AAV7NDU6_PLEWA|nr:hypothetical protein NDU88_001309 [Pleurodeles waltl]